MFVLPLGFFFFVCVLWQFGSVGGGLLLLVFFPLFVCCWRSAGTTGNTLLANILLLTQRAGNHCFAPGTAQRIPTAASLGRGGAGPGSGRRRQTRCPPAARGMLGGWLGLPAVPRECRGCQGRRWLSADSGDSRPVASPSAGKRLGRLSRYFVFRYSVVLLLHYNFYYFVILFT